MVIIFDSDHIKAGGLVDNIHETGGLNTKWKAVKCEGQGMVLSVLSL